MSNTLLNFVVAGTILIGSGVLTQLFARTMYSRCAECGTLNARRRIHCRRCQHNLKNQ